MNSFRVLGLDLGLANLGWALADLHGDGTLSPTDLGTITTKKTDKKHKVLSGDDDFRRTQEVAEAVIALFPGVRAVATEGASWPRNNRACQLIGRSWGIVGTLVVLNKIPTTNASPQAIKKAVSGNNTASKEEVMEALDTRYPQIAGFLDKRGIAKGAREHPYDAFGALVACLDSDIFQMMKEMARPSVTQGLLHPRAPAR